MFTYYLVREVHYIPALPITFGFGFSPIKGKKPGFTQKYNITRLVYYEETQYILSALAREKEIKGWRRNKKIRLILSFNPKWLDLALDWYDISDFEQG